MQRNHARSLTRSPASMAPVGTAAPPRHSTLSASCHLSEANDLMLLTSCLFVTPPPDIRLDANRFWSDVFHYALSPVGRDESRAYHYSRHAARSGSVGLGPRNCSRISMSPTPFQPGLGFASSSPFPGVARLTPTQWYQPRPPIATGISPTLATASSQPAVPRLPPRSPSSASVWTSPAPLASTSPTSGSIRGPRATTAWSTLVGRPMLSSIQARVAAEHCQAPGCKTAGVAGSKRRVAAGWGPGSPSSFLASAIPRL